LNIHVWTTYLPVVVITIIADAMLLKEASTAATATVCGGSVGVGVSRLNSSNSW
jgi:hypothetical protein